jgi:transposase
MPKAKHLTIDQIRQAISKTKSNRAAARYLGVNYHTYRKYSKLYDDPETGQTLFASHLKPSGIGIPKYLKNQSINGELPPLQKILNGEIDVAYFTVDKLKARLLYEGLLAEECNHCGFREKRVIDYKAPLLINFKDKNKRNWTLENLELVCYNCYFLHVGNVWSDSQLKQLEDYTHDKAKDKVDWEMDEYHIEHLKELGLWDEPVSQNDELDYISRI